MLRIKPFAAIRPMPNKASRVAAPPYDVVSTAEARLIADDNPECFLRVSRAELELPDSADPYSAAVYDRARANFRNLISRGVMIREDHPRLYLYRLVRDHRAQIGLVCCCHIDDYARNVIRKHEKTRPDKEEDRTRHTLAINANAGPVFLTYRDSPQIEPLVAADTNERPLYHFNNPDGVTHTIWTVRDADPYLRLFAKIDTAYVADGHHRAASAARAGDQLRAANPRHTGHEEYNWFLAVLFPTSQLRILPYNRVVSDLNDLTAAQFLLKLQSIGQIESTTSPVPPAPGAVCFYLQGTWRRLTFDPATIDRSDPIGSLDVALLQDRVLGPVLGIGDPRADKRIDFVGGIRGTADLERRVDSGAAAVAFSLFPTTMDQLLAVSDAGLIMPPKSTWFEPKLCSGLLIHTLD
jgi:uncharacterized protein (DUF1015 family)